MLKLMRQHSKYFLWLFVIVILSFVFWGIGTNDGNSVQIVAEVGPYTITAQEYWLAYDRAFRFYRDLYKENFNDEMQERLKLKDTVLETLVENRILLLAAEENGITVSNDELNDAIKNDPAFMNNGAFDKNVYLNRLRLSRLTAKTYEALKREELLAQKMRRMIELSVRPPENTLGNLTADEQTLKAISDAMLSSEKQKAVKAYVNGLRKKYDVKINRDAIS